MAERAHSAIPVTSIGMRVERREWRATPAPDVERARSVVILGRPTGTNRAIAAAFAGLGRRAELAEATRPPLLRQGDVAIAHFDVLSTPTLRR